MIKSLIRKCIPEPIITLYHFLLAHTAAILYGHPSEKLIVIGVTGTNGKSSTVQFIGRLLEEMGARVGWTTTVGFKVGSREWINDKKMTMLGRFQTQKLLKEMVNERCTHAIIETSSQGISQFRHVGIHYDVGVFTNLTPEHIEAHGGFEAYKKAKGQLFARIASEKEKWIAGTRIKKMSVVNSLDEFAAYFLSFHAGEAVTFGHNAMEIVLTKDGTRFFIENVPFQFHPIGRFNFENVLAAITTCQALGFPLTKIADAVSTLKSVPGRLEVIDEGQPFTVIVDYGPEPAALQATYQALSLLPYQNMIHVLGSTGGGRDKSRRAILGEMAAKQAQIVIVTNEDPYDDDPMEIIDDVADGATRAGKQDEVNLFRRLDRQEAIHLAVQMAQPQDLILITGKGSEPVMAVGRGRKIPWDDREAARKAIQTRYAQISF